MKVGKKPLKTRFSLSASLLLASTLTFGALSVSPRVLSLPQVNKPSESGQIKFVRGDSGRIATAEGIHLGFTAYKSKGGVSVTVFYGDFSVAQAKQVLEKRLAAAMMIIRRSPKVDSKGQVVGERAEVVLFDKDQLLSAILWTDGEKYHEIRSPSGRYALQFEKDYEY